MFTFGKGYGEVIGVLTTLGIHIRYVEPRAWKEAILQGTEKDKEAAIAWCRANYPNVNLLMTPRARVPHDGVADALCLCEYARRLLPSEMGIYS
jgi:crossover junction endodeoxyribonuclease RuvC